MKYIKNYFNIMVKDKTNSTGRGLHHTLEKQLLSDDMINGFYKKKHVRNTIGRGRALYFVMPKEKS
jgi:hypothetical protein